MTISNDFPKTSKVFKWWFIDEPFINATRHESLFEIAHIFDTGTNSFVITTVIIVVESRNPKPSHFLDHSCPFLFSLTSVFSVWRHGKVYWGNEAFSSWSRPSLLISLMDQDILSGRKKAKTFSVAGRRPKVTKSTSNNSSMHLMVPSF